MNSCVYTSSLKNTPIIDMTVKTCSFTYPELYDFFLKNNIFSINNMTSYFPYLEYIENLNVISDDDLKSQVLSKSTFAICKSGTVSLQVCSAQIPSIIIYKLNFINFMIFKFLVNVKFANIINIINNKEVIPELLQSECNANEIFKSVNYLLKKPELIRKQLEECNKTLEGIRSKSSSSTEASLILQNYLVS